jgi:adenylate cyclase
MAAPPTRGRRFRFGYAHPPYHATDAVDRPVPRVSEYPIEVAAQRAGVMAADVARMTELGLLTGRDGTYTDADIRRIQIVALLVESGLDIQSIARVVGTRGFSIGFIDQAGYDVFSALADVTFEQLSQRTGIPVDQLTVLRDVTGGKPARPDDLVREHELEILPLIEYQLELGFAWPAVERALRVYGDSLRRAAEGEAEWWRSEVEAPVLDADRPAQALAQRAGEVSPRLSEASDRALMAIYHAQQRHVWSINIVNGIRLALEQAGLHAREEPSPPAMCFLDLTGFTQLTQDLGDAVAAERVERLNRIVQRISVLHGGRPVKWLGDGVMIHFPDPAHGVMASIEMVAALSAAQLPRAHVGLHAGPVVRQEGDYYGQTVNLAARIGEYARPGEVLVSRAVVQASASSDLSFEGIGEVQLKGVNGLVDLYAARSPGGTKRPRSMRT